MISKQSISKILRNCKRKLEGHWPQQSKTQRLKALLWMKQQKQQLQVDIEQQTCSKPGKEYVKAVYCHPVYSTYIQSTLCEMLGWMKHKLESRLPGEISITSDTQWGRPGFDPLEKGKATHSRILAWRIPWSVQSMGSQRVGHDWATFTFRYADDTTLMAESQEELRVSW